MKRKKDALQGSLDLLILKVIASQPGLHGYAIMTRIKVLSEDVLRVEEGSLYPALHRMEEAGWLRAEWAVKSNGRRTRCYWLTDTGVQQLDAEADRWRRVTSAVNQVLEVT
ncbi:MAG: PadR family transcriptional regulator [Acidobacteriota bacterium]